MLYQTYEPQPDLKPVVKHFWTLEVPASPEPQRQRIVPDGLIEMAFILGDDIKRYTSEQEFILQPRALVLGQTIEPFYIEPTGYVNTFATCFYPYGLANFVTVPIKELANRETPIQELFGEAVALKLESDIIHAQDTKQRIEIIESFLTGKLREQSTVDTLVKSTIDTLLLTKGQASIGRILQDDPSKRRQLERKFAKQIGINPKQLAKVIRLQNALKMLLNSPDKNLTEIAVEHDYYDQSHFIKDFHEFTGVSPKEFIGNQNMALSALFYK